MQVSRSRNLKFLNGQKLIRYVKTKLTAKEYWQIKVRRVSIFLKGERTLGKGMKTMFGLSKHLSELGAHILLTLLQFNAQISNLLPHLALEIIGKD